MWNPGWPHTCDFTALSSGLLAGIIGIRQHSNLKCTFKTAKFMLGKFHLQLSHEIFHLVLRRRETGKVKAKSSVHYFGCL